VVSQSKYCRSNLQCSSRAISEQILIVFPIRFRATLTQFPLTVTNPIEQYFQMNSSSELIFVINISRHQYNFRAIFIDSFIFKRAAWVVRAGRLRARTRRAALGRAGVLKRGNCVQSPTAMSN